MNRHRLEGRIIMSIQSIIFNKMCKKSDAKRDEGLQIPEGINYLRDIRYGKDKKYHILDVCWPEHKNDEKADYSDKKLPVIISIHGGGYVYGSKEIYQFYAAGLAERGFAVINFNYRLAPEYKFPAPLEDLNAVIVWMMSHKNEYPFDLSNVFLVGDSAGAQLVSQYSVIYSSREYRKIMGFRKPKINIRAVGLCCGLYDLKNEIKVNGAKGLMADYLTKNPEQFGKKLDILDYINKDFPPAYLFSAEGDFLKDNCEPMAKLLTERGVHAEYKIYGTKDTGHVFHVDMRNEYGKEANDDQMEFFKKFKSV